jgi:hypothetical protein
MFVRRISSTAFRAAGAVAAIALVATGCSGGDDAGDRSTSTSSTAGPAADAELAAGPSADLSQELTAGAGPFMGATGTTDLASVGYEEQELVAAGTATSYRSETDLTEDGRWTFAEDDAADYRTRVLIRRPADAEDFSGTVVVEWLNVSGGIDANPDWAALEEEIVREGHGWVGVSAQLIGVEGGPVLVGAPGAEAFTGKGLVGIDPERYGSLSHPGDGYSFDIFTQVARAVRDGQGMGDLRPETVVAAGESQSAIALTTYYNGVQPLTEAFDGFFVHSRASVPLPLVGPGEYADLAGAIGATPALLRDDLDAPVMDLQAEGDVTGVLDSIAARQPDSDTFRLWEVAGTAHADAHLLGPIAASADCGVAINDGPLHVVAKAALSHLVGWIRDGTAPPEADLLEVTEAEPPSLVRDGDGIAVGGVRTPPVDSPVDVLSGQPGPSDDLFCLLLGSTVPLTASRLAELYPTRADYEEQYQEHTDAAIDAGVVLDADRSAIDGYAQPERISG